MQAISGSIGLAKPSTTGSTTHQDLSVGTESAGALGFLSQFLTHIDTTATESKSLHTMISDELGLEEMIGNIFPQGLPVEAMQNPKVVLNEVMQQLNLRPDQASQLELLFRNAEQDVEDLLSDRQDDVDPLVSKVNDFKQLQSGLTRIVNANIPTMAQSAVANQFGSSGWADEMASRVQWQISKDIQEARISINPRELGPVEVKVNLSDDQAQVQFISHHSAVRDAVEEAIPRLREMLEASGITLTDANVSDQQAFESSREQQPDQEKVNDEFVDESEDTLPVVTRILNGLVDAYI